MRYESHLAPPPHLVGLRIAALDALLSRRARRGRVASAAALAEKLPDPDLRPHGFEIEKGGLLDLDEAAAQLVACGYERIDQVEERGQFAIRGDILDVYPATEERAVRCELFDIEVERLTWFSTFTQRSLEEAERVEIAPAAELGPEHRELAEIAASSAEGERPDVAELLPVDRFCELLELVPDERAGGRGGRGGAGAGAERPVGGRHHQLPRRGRPPPVRPPRAPDRDPRRPRVAAAVEHLPGPAARVPRPERRHRRSLVARRRARAGEARALGLPHGCGVGAGAARPRGPQLNMARVQAGFLDGGPAPVEPTVLFAARRTARGLSRSPAQAGDRARTQAAASSPGPAPGGPQPRGDRLLHRPAGGLAGGARGPRHRPLCRLRYQDRRRRHARLPRARIQRRRPRVRPQRPAAQDQPLRGRRRRRPAAVQAGRQAMGAAEAPRAARRRGARRRADQPLRRAPPARRSRLPARLASGSSTSRPAFPTARQPTSSMRSRPCAPTWRRRARWTA